MSEKISETELQTNTTKKQNNNNNKKSNSGKALEIQNRLYCDETKPVHTALVCIRPPPPVTISMQSSVPAIWCICGCGRRLNAWKMNVFFATNVYVFLFGVTAVATISELYLSVEMPRKSCKSSEHNQHVNHPWAQYVVHDHNMICDGIDSTAFIILDSAAIYLSEPILMKKKTWFVHWEPTTRGHSV